jgi:glycosyltransferase involved in cell wall biosynthesis
MIEFTEYSLLSEYRKSNDEIFFSIAIPHYRYRENLQIAIESILKQKFSNFEIIISDDCSPCDAHEIVPKELEKHLVNFQYFRHEKNQGYDRNVRFCIQKSKGKYVFLLGNDDDLTDEFVLQQLHDKLIKLNLPDLAFTSYSDYVTGELIRRAQTTRVYEGNVFNAVKIYRAYSFVSGLIYNKNAALKIETDIWDKSVYYQFYLACKLMCEGHKVASLDVNAVRINTAINGEKVPTAAKRPNTEWSFTPRYNGMDSVIRVVANTIIPYVEWDKKSKVLKDIIIQIYSISYPHALMHYRTHRNWSYSVGVARRMRPEIIFAEYIYPVSDAPISYFNFKLSHRIILRIIYIISTLAGLVVPVQAYEYLKPKLGDLVRKIQQT